MAGEYPAWPNDPVLINHPLPPWPVTVCSGRCQPVKARFGDRAAAGRRLGAELAANAVGAPRATQVGSASTADRVVLGLPRGGVPVAAEVAHVLGAPFDVFVVRKLGVPTQPELAFGAVAGGGVRVLNSDVVSGAGLDPATIDRLTAAAMAEVGRRERTYRGDRPALALGGRAVILVDDGIATGATVRAALAAVRAQAPASVVVAAPVAPVAVVRLLADVADDVTVLVAAPRFGSVGSFYQNFAQLSDADVQAIMAERG
jgi:putative phosphoribosyl transferase